MATPVADPLREMLAYLRDNPSAAHSSSELAARFNLEPAFVARVLGGLPTQDAEGTRIRAREALSGAQRLVARVAAALDWFFGRAVLASVVFMFLGWLAVSALSSMLPGKVQLGHLNSASVTVLFAAAVTGSAFFLLAMLAFFKTRSTKAAAISGAIFYALMLFVELRKFFSAAPIPENYTRGQTVGIGIASATFVAIAGWGLANLFSIWGQWSEARNRERRLSRHDLLQRYLDLNERLSKAVDVPSGQREKALGRFTRKHGFFVTYVTGSVIYTAFVFISHSFGINPYADTPPAAATASAYFTLALVLTFLAWCVWATVSFLAESVWRAILVSIALVAAYYTAMLVSHFAFWPIHFRPALVAGAVVTTLMYIGIGALIGIGGQMRARTARMKLLEANDRATLLSELVQVQWRLAERPLEVCVLVIDAVQSSRMKAESDPLVAEYAFRSYQAWIERVVLKHKGRIHSTAGDGAVVAFPTAALAFSAAEELRDDLARFNSEENKLPIPFRVRIGLHVGCVVAELDKVQFSEVIDIAAHVEKVAPENGIALSEAVARELSVDGLSELPGLVDGQRVHAVGSVPANA